MKKILCIVLSLLTIVCFVSCNPDVDESGNSAASSDVSPAESETSGTAVKYEADIPDVYYEGTDFPIYTFSNIGQSAGFSHFGTGLEELEANAVNTAVIERNNKVEEQLGVNILEYAVEDNIRVGGPAYDACLNMLSAGTETYYLLLPSTRSGASLASANMLYDLMSLPYLHNLTEPWWDEFFVNEMTVNGKLHYVTGDICIYSRVSANFYIFNKTLFEKYSIEMPYSYVDEMKWTLDVLYSMAKNLCIEADGVNGIDYHDYYGIGGQTDQILMMFFGCGGRIAKNTGNGFDDTLYNENTAKYVEKILEIMKDDNCYIASNDYVDRTSEYKNSPTEMVSNAFLNDHSLFYIGHANSMIKQCSTMKSDYGPLPTPLYDENQESYYQMLNYWSSDTIAIPYYLSDDEAEMASIVLEALGAETKNNVTNALMETTLNYQKTRDDESMRMLDVIFNSIAVEPATVYNWGGITGYMESLVKTNTSFETMYQSVQSMLESAINATNDSLN